MTPESQRIAIAEACPKIRFFEGEQAWCYHDGQHWTPCKNNDPLNDLNAMYEAEKVLGPKQKPDYCRELSSIVVTANSNSDWKLLHATAAQRAEAFWRTLGLRKD